MEYDQAVQDMKRAVSAYDSLLVIHSDLLLQLEEAEHHLQQTEIHFEYGNATVSDVKLAMEKCVAAERALGEVVHDAVTAMNDARHKMYAAYESKKLKQFSL